MTDRRIAEALGLHATGRIADAVRLSLEVLASDAEQPDALHLLGVVALDAGQPEQAIGLIGRALRSRPYEAAMHNNLGNAERRLQRGMAATLCYRRALACLPDAGQIWINLGAALTEAMTGSTAASAYRRALALDPDSADAHLAQGLTGRGAGRDGSSGFKRAISLQPVLAQAWFQLANGMLAGDVGAAERAYGRVTALEPGDAAAWTNCGAARHRLGRLGAAAAALGRALEIDPELADAHNALGSLRLDQERAAEAERCFRMAVLLRPDFAVAHYHHGNAVFQLGRMAAAATAFRRALGCDGALAAAAINLGNTLRDQGRTEGARRAYDRALGITELPGARVRRATLLPIIPESIAAIEMSRTAMRDAVEDLIRGGITLADPLGEVGAANFYLAYHALDDRPQQEQLARFYRGACPSLSQELAGRRATPRADGRISVGFVSTLLRTHTIGRLNLGLIRHLDRRRFHVSVIGPAHAGDELAQLIAAAADQTIALPRNLEAARRVIAGAGLHVLYYPDVGMDPLTYFLAFARLAPLQVTSWGHPDTTGLDSVDYFLSADAMEPKDAEAHYTERLARLAGPTVCIERPRLPAAAKTRAELGLPEAATLYVCPQSLFKLHPDFDPVLRRILDADRMGRLVLIHGKDRHWAELVLARLGPSAARRTIVLPMLSSSDFLSLLACADVMLDPIHYSGGHTSLEALALGLPIVTWPGRFMRARHTYGFYRLMGYEDLVAADPDHYVELALALGRDRGLRGAARRRIIAASAVLYDNRQTVAAIGDYLEAALAARW